MLFTADPGGRRRDRVVINAAWGLGEAVVGRRVTPDGPRQTDYAGQITPDGLRWASHAGRVTLDTLVVETGSRAREKCRARRSGRGGGERGGERSGERGLAQKTRDKPLVPHAALEGPRAESCLLRAAC